MLYNDIKKVMVVIDGIATPTHCDVAERMVKRLAIVHNLFHKGGGIIDLLTENRRLEYDSVVVGLLNKIYSIRKELNTY